MRILIDTNVLLRLEEPTHPLSQTASSAVAALRAAGHTLVIVPQSLYEFWTVATRTVAANGLGLSAADARSSVDHLRGLYQLRRDERAILSIWLRLVTEHAVTGVNSYDARLVAAMERHGLDAVLTFNGKDFRRFPNVDVLDPVAVAADQGSPE